MCIVYFAYQTCPEWPIIIAANRDEFHARPTLASAPWESAPSILGGIDLMAGGTWLASDTQGRIGFLTNYREPQSTRNDAPSRGHLISRYLQNSEPAHSYLEQVQQVAEQYNGFNIVLGDAKALYYYSNKQDGIQSIASGHHVLSNHLLNSPWPKSEKLRQGFALLPLKDLLNSGNLEPLFNCLYDQEKAFDEELPRTGISLEWERLLSSPFIISEDYGTRCSTILAIHQNGQAFFTERRFDVMGHVIGEQQFWPWRG